MRARRRWFIWMGGWVGGIRGRGESHTLSCMGGLVGGRGETDKSKKHATHPPTSAP